MIELAHASTNASPENLYGIATHPQERRRLQGEVVQRYALRINALVRRQAKGRDKDEAQQVGMLALLEALCHFDPTRGASFWTFAFPRVRSAIANWASSELGAKRSRRAADDPRELRAAERRRPESFDETTHGATDADPETLAIAAEESLRLAVFESGLSPEDRRALVPTAGRPRKGSAGRNNDLRERAKSFLRGQS